MSSDWNVGSDPKKSTKTAMPEKKIYIYNYIDNIIPWKSKTKQRMVFGMIDVKDSLLLTGKVLSLDFLGIYI